MTSSPRIQGLQNKQSKVSKKKTNHLCEGWIAKFIPRDHCLPAFDKPLDAKRVTQTVGHSDRKVEIKSADDNKSK